MQYSLSPWNALRSFGQDIIEAEDGHEALNPLKTEATSDLLITNLAFPHTDGVQWIKIAREHYSKLLIIAISTADEFSAHARANGAEDEQAHQPSTTHTYDRCLRPTVDRLRTTRCFPSRFPNPPFFVGSFSGIFRFSLRVACVGKALS